jgi:2-oxoglutarate dehydrogenase E2 component (dihydrolipoamide succinyltransferase)
VPLGFMSFFSRACVLALEEFKVVNAEVRGDDIVYKHHVHLGIAVGSERGLVVPVVRHAERMTFADLEREIGRLAGLARDGKLTPDDLAGGTFTISNGGIYGSLMSTPILNPPQSGILGMHKIEKRPVVVNDQVAVRPMMYVALSYDHRIVDGEQAVSFLVRVKERLEDPARLLLDV